MTIKSALALSDSLAKAKNLTPEQWAIRVLAGAYRRERSAGLLETAKRKLTA